MLKKANPLEQLDGVELFQEDTKVSSVPALDLFKEGRLIGTLMIWLAFFCCLLMVYVGDRWGLPRVMVGFFILSALSISLLGFNSPMVILYGLIIIAGATTIGTQILLYANAAQYYPLSMRSSGLGWASGIGRTGAIAGPFLGGTLMAMALHLKLNFYAFALPGVISALAIVVLILSVQHQAAMRRTVVAA